jgi:3-oxoacyl-[acyl-carrier protein] reductase
VTAEIDFSGRSALVVGGGGGGIGTAVVMALARAGANIGAITNDPDHAEDTADRLIEFSRTSEVVIADVTNDNALVEAIASMKSRLGPIRYLVNVVGGVRRATDRHEAIDYDMEAFDRIIQENLRYVFVSCREFARALAVTGEPGAIVNFTSPSTRAGPLRAAYAAGKAGVEAYSRTIALEWGRYGIRVNVISPKARTPRSLPEQAEPRLTYPLGRQAEPYEVANVTLLLLSDLSAGMTGQTLSVDGGLSLMFYGRDVDQAMTM